MPQDELKESALRAKPFIRVLGWISGALGLVEVLAKAGTSLLESNDKLAKFGLGAEVVAWANHVPWRFVIVTAAASFIPLVTKWGWPRLNLLAHHVLYSWQQASLALEEKKLALEEQRLALDHKRLALSQAREPHVLPTSANASTGSDVDSWFHLDQFAATLAAPYYRRALTVHAKLLRLSAEEFAERAQIPRRVAQVLLDQPTKIARPDLWPRIAKALLILPEFFQNGKTAYDTTLARQRLNRYRDKGLVEGHVWDKISKSHANSIRAFVRHAEKIRCREEGLDSPEVRA